jgi:hypothetical protein
MNWFERLTGFAEGSPEQVRSNIRVEGEYLTSSMNGATYRHGRLEVPSLAELRDRTRSSEGDGRISVRQISADVRALHRDPANAGSLFQVASQFNLLEMINPEVTPEAGVGIYENDATQGPACAIACGAGTIYRNYFAPVNGSVGQSAENQIDCLRDLSEEWGNRDSRLWRMSNGYVFTTADGLSEISKRLRSADEGELDHLRGLLRIGTQWNTEVTDQGVGHTVSQAYCSALPVGYSTHSPGSWEPFARLVLEAAYEATLLAALQNAGESGTGRVFLTHLGGGVFRNRTEWIVDAMERALRVLLDRRLDVVIVNHGTAKPEISEMINRLGI